MDEYWNLKRHPNETVQDFSTRLNSVYDFIPTDINPPLRLAMLHYPDGFNANISYYLRERNSSTLEDMQKSVIDVKMDLLIKRYIMETEIRKVIKEEFPHLLNLKLNTLMKTMERFMNTFILQDNLLLVENKIYLLFKQRWKKKERLLGHITKR